MNPQVEELRNPATRGFIWTEEQALAAIKDGTAHAMAVSGFMIAFGGEPTTLAYRFLDEEVGKRVAAHTLRGFDVEVPA